MTILVFTRTTGFRHDSIPTGVQALRELHGDIEVTEDPGDFTSGRLAGFAAIVFLNTNGEILTRAGRKAFETYARDGGGFLGVHSAAATEYGWPFYGDLVGAWFDKHPAVQPATIVVSDPNHPATTHLPSAWSSTDEWYDFRTHPQAHILLRVDESTYDGGGMGTDHPVAWCHERLGGRAFYTALGHTIESYAEPALRAHLSGGLTWVSGA